MFDPRSYWEKRAREYGSSTGGWKAVCLQGTPEIYNRLIHRLQRSALLSAMGGAPSRLYLDFGCGVGRWMVELAPRAKAVCGVDISREMLGEAERRLRAAHLLNFGLCQFDGSNLPFKDARFDVTFSATVLIHITELETLKRAVGEMCRVTAPGGRVVVLESFAQEPVDSPSHVKFRKEEEMVEIFREAGWILQSSRTVYSRIPGESSVASRRSRMIFRLLSPLYYLLNVWGRMLSLEGAPPVQKVQVYRYEREL